MAEERVELLTYCVVDENKKNRACILPSKELNSWKKRYVGCFNYSNLSESGSPRDVQEYYLDPDETYKKKEYYLGPDSNDKSDPEPLFFDHLVQFLNNQERKFFTSDKESFEYSFVEGEGIEVKTKGSKEFLFYLHSDQLGFSAPTNNKIHPYVLYILRCNCTDKAIKKVATWIAKTRTIGGSFLWPACSSEDRSQGKRCFYSNYNCQRGGSIITGNNMQDRVDLALNEVKNWYSRHKENNPDAGEGDILKTWETASGLGAWLGHFGSFSTYVKFFCFDSFVDEKAMPNCIVPGKTVPQLSRSREKEITLCMSRGRLKTMLDGLSENVLNRSERMLRVINDEQDLDLAD